MKQGKYVCHNGRFIHEDDDDKPFSWKAFMVAAFTGLTIWFFILLGIGVL